MPHGGAYGYGGIAPQGYIAVAGDKLVIAGGRGLPAFICRHTGKSEKASFHTKSEGDYAVHGVDGGGIGKRTNDMLTERSDSIKEEIEGEIFYKMAFDGRLVVVTCRGKIYCFGPDEVKAHHHEFIPSDIGISTEYKSDRWRPVAQELLERLGEEEGYALLLGAGSGGLLYELLRGSNLHVVVVEEDASAVGSLRDELAQSGVYGRRAAVIHGNPASFSVQPYLFSMVLSEDAVEAGIKADAGNVGRILNLLRPYGAVAWLGIDSDHGADLYEAAVSADTDQVEPENRADALFAVRNGPLSGAGEWTHQYHNAANTLLSMDSLVRLPLGMLWFGGPTNHNILPRHTAAPRPQVAGGRQVFLGVETISARCVYTGRQLWEQEFSGIGHPFTNIEEEKRWAQGHYVPMSPKAGANHIGSPFVTVRDGIYLRYKGEIYRLSPSDGETLDRFSLPGRTVEELYDDQDAPDWGHISVQGDFLITTFEPHILEDADLGDRNYSGTSSGGIAVMDRYDGEVLWQAEASVGFRHTAIVSSEDKLYVIDGLSDSAMDRLARRGERPEEPTRLISFDMHSGEEIWTVDSDIFGTFLLYSEENNILVEGGSHDTGRTLRGEPRRIAARCSRDGSLIWERSRFSLPGSISGEMLIPGRAGEAVSLLTGETWLRTEPHTGRRSNWTYARRYGCDTHNASKNLLYFRTGYAGFFDLEHDTGTGTFGGFRSGCTANLIAADGVLSALDYTRTCTCSYPHQTSLAMVHMPGDSNIEFWTRYDAAEPDPESFGINWGAPGRRVDVAGTGRIWHDREGTKRRHPSAIIDAGGGIDWVAASVREGESEIVIDDLLNATYRVRLHFADLKEDAVPRERLFDVIINDVECLSRLDVAGEAGGPLHGLVKELEVELEGELVIELRRSEGSVLDPIISGIELIRL